MASTMFDKYGGFGTLSKVVMAFYDKVLDSEAAGRYFDGIDMRRLVDHQTKFIASVMGGPASYTDEALRLAHAHLGVDRAAFEEMTRLLEKTLAEFRFDEADAKRILAEVRSRADLIVTARD